MSARCNPPWECQRRRAWPSHVGSGTTTSRSQSQRAVFAKPRCRARQSQTKKNEDAPRHVRSNQHNCHPAPDASAAHDDDGTSTDTGHALVTKEGVISRELFFDEVFVVSTNVIRTYKRFLGRFLLSRRREPVSSGCFCDGPENIFIEVSSPFAPAVGIVGGE